ncbi:MAG: hypothetical protein ACM3QZ_06790 [Solirubrobacterales bacterium]
MTVSTKVILLTLLAAFVLFIVAILVGMRGSKPGLSDEEDDDDIPWGDGEA